MSRHNHHARLLAHAARMRSWLTPSEATLFEAIRAKKLGVQFRRQVVLGERFVVDFFAAEAGLVVEVDGECHLRRQRADARRDQKLQRLGYRVLRLEARLIMEELPLAVHRVREALAQS